MHYSVQPRDRIFAKGSGLLSFAKNMGKNIGKNISKNLHGKYSQKKDILYLIPEERNISPEEKQQNNDELRII